MDHGVANFCLVSMEWGDVCLAGVVFLSLKYSFGLPFREVECAMSTSRSWVARI